MKALILIIDPRDYFYPYSDKVFLCFRLLSSPSSLNFCAWVSLPYLVVSIALIIDQNSLENSYFITLTIIDRVLKDFIGVCTLTSSSLWVL